MSRLNKPAIICFVLLSLLSIAPTFAVGDTYYFPIRPGQRNYLSGTMGELRTAHFHAGIDIKTGGVEGLKVYAAQAGYISRIKVSPSGYGNVLYIAHPHLGTTTVYGHLKAFREDIADYIRNEQYTRKRFAVEVFPSVKMFPVRKGEVIAYSGNSGSSGGPHLHFEIRDGHQRPVNPLQYRFDEVKDRIAPTIQRIALKTLDIDSRINGRFGFFEFTPYRNGNRYHIGETIEASGRIGVHVMAFDRLDGASNRNGVPHLDLKINGEAVFAIDIDTFAFSQSREILVYRDHERKLMNNRTYQKLYVDDGNKLPFYDRARTEGILSMIDGARRAVDLELRDAYGNTTTATFSIAAVPARTDTAIVTSKFDFETFKVLDNTLKIMAGDDQAPAVAEVFANRIKYVVRPAYAVNSHNVFLWDLREGLPDSVRLGDSVERPGIDMLVPSGGDFSYYQPHLDLHFSANSLFDTAYLKTTYLLDKHSGLEYFEIGDPAQPLRGRFTAVLKPRIRYRHRARVHAYHTDDGKSFSYQGGEWNGAQFEFRTREFGRYTLLADTLAPTIRVVTQNRNHFRCYVDDDLSGISRIELHIGGQWVLLHYDPKRRYCWSEKQDASRPFVGEIALQVIDNAQNEKIYTGTID